MEHSPVSILFGKKIIDIKNSLKYQKIKGLFHCNGSIYISRNILGHKYVVLTFDINQDI